MHEYAITVIGRDRPGIIAETAEILARLECNLTDSTMTRLRGHFAMTLVCSGEATPASVEAALAVLASDDSLVVAVWELGAEPDEAGDGGHYVLSLHGADRLGIVAAIARLLADAGGNVTDLSTRLSGELYVLVAEVDLPATVDIASLTSQLDAVAADLGVEAQLRQADMDLL